MHAVLLLMFVLFNFALLHAVPSAMFYSDDQFRGYNDIDQMQMGHLAKRMAMPAWIHKRNPALCDYRLQLRPSPMTSALCAYGEFNCSSTVSAMLFCSRAKQRRCRFPSSTIQIWLDVLSYGFLRESTPSDDFFRINNSEKRNISTVPPCCISYIFPT